MPPDPHTTGSIAAHLSERLGARGAVELLGPANIPLRGLDSLDRAEAGSLTFIRGAAFAQRWASSRASAALVTRTVPVAGHDPASRALIVVPDADLALNIVLDLFAPASEAAPAGVHPTAVVNAGASLGRGVSVGPWCVIGARTSVGDGTVLHAGVSLGRDVRVGRACTLMPHVAVLDRCTVGDACILHAGVVIGADGFGYRPRADGRGVEKIPHIGNVQIGSDVEIGANSCVDRAKYGSTVVGDGTKIDNLVQVGHGCRIGRACLIAGQVGLAGSVTLGDGVQVGGQAGFADNITVAPGTLVAAKAGVIRSVKKGTYFGTPAEPLTLWMRMHATLKRVAQGKRVTPVDADTQARVRGTS